MKLRDYQNAAVEGVLNAWKTCRSALCVLPTGCGKTVVFAEVIRRMLFSRPGGRATHAMILAHREELVHQAADKVSKVAGVDCEIEMGDYRVIGMMGCLPPVVVSSVQTHMSGRNGQKRMMKFNPKDFSVLVVDEAHHATSPSYRACIDRYLRENPECRLLGVTATPDRADELALGSVFETVAASYDISDAIRDGWLVPVEQRIVTVGSLDFSSVKTTAGDLNPGELADIMEEERNLHAVAAPVLDILKEKRAIIFATSVRQAERLAEILNRGEGDGDSGSGNGERKRADWLCGATPKDLRHDKLAAFKEGRTQFMVNVGVLTEGFDDAGVEAVVMARPTKSRALYAQMIGRATRPSAKIAAKLGEVEERLNAGDFRTQSPSANAELDETCAATTPTPDGVGYAATAFRPASPKTHDAQNADKAFFDCGVATEGRVVATSENASLCVSRSDLRSNTCVPKSAAERRRALIAGSDKPKCLVLDFVGNAGRHKLITSADILGGKYPDEVIERAKRKARDRNIDMSVALEEANVEHEEIERRKRIEAERRKSIRAVAPFCLTRVNPFDAFDLPPMPVLPNEPPRRFTPKQAAFLRNYFKVDPMSLTYAQGKQLLDAYGRRKQANLASIWQVSLLRRKGIPVPMRFDEARRALARRCA